MDNQERLPRRVRRGFRAERLSARWLLSLVDTRENVEAWPRCYKENRPHGAIGYTPPIAIIKPDVGADHPS